MPTNFEQALGVIDQVVAGYPAGFNDNALTYFPDFVEVYGQDEAHLDLSIKNWYGKNEYTNWIVKHGCRTLLKKGNKAALDIFGFADTNQEKTKGFHLMAQSLSIGEALSFLFTILAK